MTPYHEYGRLRERPANWSSQSLLESIHQHGVDHFLVPAEGFHQILADSGRVGDALHEPDVAIEPVLVLRLDRGAPGLPSAGELLELAHVPILRKDKFGPFLDGGEDVFGAWDEFIVIVQSAPMDALVGQLPGVGIAVWRLCARVSVAADVMD